MTRAHFVTYLLDTEGRPIPGATTTVRTPDTETAISETIYQTDTSGGSATKSNPFTADADGRCEIWLENPKVVDVLVTKTGYDPKTIRGTVHTLTASSLVFKDDGSAMTQRAGINFVGPFVLSDDSINGETDIALDWGEAGDITPVAFGDSANAGASGEIADAGHRHAAPANPVTAHEAAGDPHTVYLKESDFDDVNFLVGTATGLTAAEIIVGTTPGGELGGTWAAPTVDATHAGTTHSAATDTHIADATDAHDASAISIADAGGNFAATEVEAALAELAGDVSTFQRLKKTANETVNNSTVLQDDNHLIVPVLANEDWELEMHLFGSSPGTAGNLKMKFTVPAAGALSGNLWGKEIGNGDLPAMAAWTATSEATSSFPDIDTDGTHEVVAFLAYTGGANAGNVTLQWACENTGGSDSTTLYAGSFILARKV